MDATTLLVGLGVPVLSFGSGYLTHRYTKGERRTKIANDLALLQQLKPGVAHDALERTIESRVSDLAAEEGRKRESELYRALVKTALASFTIALLCFCVAHPPSIEGWQGAANVIGWVALALAVVTYLAGVGGQSITLVAEVRTRRHAGSD